MGRGPNYTLFREIQSIGAENGDGGRTLSRFTTSDWPWSVSHRQAHLRKIKVSVEQIHRNKWTWKKSLPLMNQTGNNVSNGTSKQIWDRVHRWCMHGATGPIGSDTELQGMKTRVHAAMQCSAHTSLKAWAQIFTFPLQQSRKSQISISFTWQHTGRTGDTTLRLQVKGTNEVTSFLSPGDGRVGERRCKATHIDTVGCVGLIL